jgi:hypothetical protein
MGLVGVEVVFVLWVGDDRRAWVNALIFVEIDGSLVLQADRPGRS